jgi:hypothetical protein
MDKKETFGWSVKIQDLQGTKYFPDKSAKKKKNRSGK